MEEKMGLNLLPPERSKILLITFEADMNFYKEFDQVNRSFKTEVTEACALVCNDQLVRFSPKRQLLAFFRYK